LLARRRSASTRNETASSKSIPSGATLALALTLTLTLALALTLTLTLTRCRSKRSLEEMKAEMEVMAPALLP